VGVGIAGHAISFWYIVREKRGLKAYPSPSISSTEHKKDTSQPVILKARISYTPHGNMRGSSVMYTIDGVLTRLHRLGWDEWEDPKDNRY
jgi:hypothetical protein